MVQQDLDPRGDSVLEVSGVHKSFAGVHALRDVDFALRPAEVHALIGENGAGKSTLIKVITGVYRPDSGTVRLDGRERDFRNPLEAQAAGISTIYQEVNLVPLMSVARNLFLGREPRRFGLVDVGRMNREAAEVLGRYGVDVDVTRPLRTLGLGAQQMVALARAVQIDARVVIMDEPTSSLEPREVETLFSVIRRLKEQGIAVVYVSHRLDELYAICDRVTVMRDGEVVHTGEIAQLERLRLISLMLGREMATVRDKGTTAFDTDRHERQTGRPVLSAEGLTVRHRLHDVSLDIHPGEVVGLGGLLGAGRSETAKAIVGALGTDAGSVEIEGKPLHRRSPAAAIRAGVVMLAEDRKAEGIIPNLSVRENISLAALPRLSRAGVVSQAKQDEVVRLFMERLRIKASGPDQKVSDLSGGNQQKVLLARWLCLNPKVLLLDEPTRGIDVGAKAEVQSIIDELAADGLGVLLISSDLEELIEGSDRVVILKDGHVVGNLDGEDVSEDGLLDALATAPPLSPDDPDLPEQPGPATGPENPGGTPRAGSDPAAAPVKEKQR
ncbi:sugar ABC transporter ATP-binding protein [Actinacidiphila acidipaludis]|uniref:ATP-binding cassette domain-containing protein n=1 Tax=Actinacidiphila acidipaludis TaxID=2873382 RepID=A0ABS7QDM4_9ACTN|nr:ATP-binding cassette domain-containing protein [Streptomyces acidipaludis]MBY8881272.1 ATP-binding cassette domain-containing protein [Streptomyces acidipaludis]